MNGRSIQFTVPRASDFTYNFPKQQYAKIIKNGIETSSIYFLSISIQISFAFLFKYPSFANL